MDSVDDTVQESDRLRNITVSLQAQLKQNMTALDEKLRRAREYVAKVTQNALLTWLRVNANSNQYNEKKRKYKAQFCLTFLLGNGWLQVRLKDYFLSSGSSYCSLRPRQRIVAGCGCILWPFPMLFITCILKESCQKQPEHNKVQGVCSQQWIRTRSKAVGRTPSALDLYCDWKSLKLKIVFSRFYLLMFFLWWNVFSFVCGFFFRSRQKFSQKLL